MRIELIFTNKRKMLMAISVSPKMRSVRSVSPKKSTNPEGELRAKYVVFKKGKTICLAEKGLNSETFNVTTVQRISAGDPVSILSNGMSRVQIARISRTLNNSGAKITIVNK